MKKQIFKLLLALALVCVLFTGTSVAFGATKITTTATGYTSAEDVKYMTSGGYVVNWGARGEDCVFLSTYAQNYYTGSDTYDNFATLSGGTSQSNAPQSALYKELKDMMTSKHKHQTSYGETRDQYKYTDCVSNDYNHISSFYSGKQLNGEWDGGNTWNREHTWPNSKGLGGNDENDIMMLRPTWKQENSSRGNTAYGESSSYYDPGISTRGDCARIVLYVYTRWGNTSNMWGTGGVMENMNVLLKWMEEDPVDTWEMGRNDAVQSITGVRNVFVDYPELAWQLFGKEMPASVVTPSGGQAEPPTAITLSASSINLVKGNSQTITVTPTPSDASKSVTWTTSNSAVATVANGTVTATGAGTATITATSTLDSTVKATLQVTVKSATGIVVEGTANRVNYLDGDKFDPTGLTVKLVYNDGTSDVIPNANCTWVDTANNSATLTGSTTSVTCKYSGFSALATNVTIKSATGIAVSGTPNIVTYAVGETFDPTGLTVKLLYNDGTSDVISLDQCTWLDSKTNLATLDENTSAVVCKYKTFTYTVQGITTKSITGIAVTGTPVDKIYAVGQAFDPTGLTVTVTYTDSSTETIPTSACSWVDSVTGSEQLNENTTAVMCKFGAFNCTVNGVVMKKIVSIQISGVAKKVEYYEGETFDSTGLTVQAVYNDGDVQNLAGKDCYWLDGTTGAFVLSHGSTTVICSYKTHRATVTGISVGLAKAQVEFIESVNKASATTDVYQQFSAIKTAFAKYNALSAIHKVDVAQYYQQLQTLATKYDSMANEQNEQTKQAITMASGYLAVTALAMAAALFALGKKW